MNKILLISLLFIFACSTNDRLETALEMSGKNRAELEKVLGYYSKDKADSLKLRAAIYLIENMPGHYNLYGGSVKSYIEQFDSLNPNVFLFTKSYYYSLPLENESSISLMERRYDIESITADFLIKNIDFKFKLWSKMMWKDQLSFEKFCEYILPYRFENEILVDVPQIELDNIITRLSDFQSIADYNTTMSEAKEYLKEKVFADKDKSYFVTTPGNIPYNVRDCNAAALIYAEQNRFLGIPVTIDFVPHWGNSSGRHTWYKK